MAKDHLVSSFLQASAIVILHMTRLMASRLNSSWKIRREIRLMETSCMVIK